MKLADYRLILDNIVRKTLYECSELNFVENKNLDEISSLLNESNNYIDDLRSLIMSRNNENYFVYNKFVGRFIANSKLDVKLNLLNNYNDYEDIMNNKDLYYSLWDSLSCDEKVNYLNSKKKFSEIDYLLINHSVKECGGFKCNKVLEELIDNDKLRSKVANNTISLNYSYKLLSNINLNDYDLCRIFTKESYSKLLLKKCKRFNEFKNFLNSNKKLYKLIARNSLIFNSEDNETIYKFILKNHNFIGKFDLHYSNLFSIMEIAKISEDPNLDEDAFSTVLQKLYMFNKEKADNLFKKENLLKCSKHSICLNPFYDLNEKTKKVIFSDYDIFNRFVDTVMVEAINDYYSEEEIINFLRNDTFINDISSYALELLINKLSFKAAFNMMQRQIIFNKIKNLNVKVNENDKLFFKGFLDSPILLYKSEHNMIYEMLSMLTKEDVIYYITLPYINNCMSNNEIVNLIIKFEINIMDIIDCIELFNRLNTTDVISVIDKTFEKNPDLNIFKH